MNSRLDCTVVPLQHIDTERKAFQKDLNLSLFPPGKCAPKLEQFSHHQPISFVAELCFVFWWCFTGSPMVNQHFSPHGEYVFLFPTNRTSKSKRLRSLPACCYCFRLSQQWGCRGTTGFTNATAWSSILVKSWHGHFDPFSMWDFFGSL